MPIAADRKDGLSLYLVMQIEIVVKEFCGEKKISNNEILEILDCSALNLLVRNLGLKVKVEELVEEPVTVEVERETPLEIIDRIVTKVADNEVVDSPRFGIEAALSGDPIVIL